MYKSTKQEKLEWLLKNFKKYNLGNYNWGLEDNRQEYIRRMYRIFNDMIKDGLYSERTIMRDIGLFNYIREVQTLHRKLI